MWCQTASRRASAWRPRRPGRLRRPTRSRQLQVTGRGASPVATARARLVSSLTPMVQSTTPTMRRRPRLRLSVGVSAERRSNLRRRPRRRKTIRRTRPVLLYRALLVSRNVLSQKAQPALRASWKRMMLRRFNSVKMARTSHQLMVGMARPNLRTRRRRRPMRTKRGKRCAEKSRS